MHSDRIPQPFQIPVDGIGPQWRIEPSTGRMTGDVAAK